MLGYLPAKFKIRFLEPIDTVELGGADAVHDKALVQTVSQEIRARIQENLHEMVGEAEVRLVRMRGASPPDPVTGLSTYWGGRLAQALEGFEQIETIIGVDSREPTRELERTEFVKVSNQHSLIQRIVRAAEIDTVIDTRMVVNSLAAPAREAHENNVIGTMNILAACTGVGLAGAQVRLQELDPLLRLRAGRPGLLHRADAPPAPAPTRCSSATSSRPRQAVADFADKRPDVTVTVLRCANVLGPDVDTSFTRMFALPVVPMVLGFDPRLQFVHEDDVVHALEHAALNELPGTFNVAADGVLALSEAISLVGKRAAAGAAAVRHRAR